MSDAFKPAPREFVRWLQRVTKLVDDDGPVSKLELHAIPENFNPSRISTYMLIDEDTSRTSEELASVIYEASVNHCDAALVGGPIQFAVYAFDQVNREHKDSFTWTLTASAPRLRGAPDPGIPRPQNMQDHALATIVKALSANHELLLSHMAPMLEHSRKTQERLSEQLNAAQEQNFRLLDLMAQVQLNIKKGEMDLEKGQMQERRKHDWHRLMMSAAPMVLAGLNTAISRGLPQPAQAQPQAPAQPQPQTQTLPQEPQPNAMPAASTGAAPPAVAPVAEQSVDQMRAMLRDLNAHLTADEQHRVCLSLTDMNARIFSQILAECARPSRFVAGRDIIRPMVIELYRGLDQEQIEKAATELTPDNMQRFIAIAMIASQDAAAAEEDYPAALRQT